MARRRGFSFFPAFFLLLALSGAGGCFWGGSGGGPEVVTPPAVDLTGAYDLFAFDIYYYADSAGTLPAGHETEADFDSFFGSMSIDLFTTTTGDIFQAIGRNGVTDFDFTGAFAISSPGIFTITPTAGLPFNLSFTPGTGYYLATQTQMYYDPGLLLYFTEIDHWTKFSDIP